MFRFKRTIISLFVGLWTALILSTAASAAPRQTTGPKITYASGPEFQAMIVKRGRFHYPWLARRDYRSGRGLYRVYVNPNGKVRTVGVLRSTGHQDLDLAAAAGLYQCVILSNRRAGETLFKPGRRRELDLPVTFTLTRQRWSSGATDIRRTIPP